MSDDLNGVVDVVKKYAPTVASYLGGPFAGAVVDLLMRQYGIKDKNDLPALAQQITDNPWKLKELEISEREHMGDRMFGLLEIVGQRGSNAILALLAVVCGMGMLGYLAFLIWQGLK